jgi:hypothetical protein
MQENIKQNESIETQENKDEKKGFSFKELLIIFLS